ncbi:MAG: hypothetical protein P8Z38_12255 [Robiginitalea sp.]
MNAKVSKMVSLRWMLVVLLFPLFGQAQCEIFKSEISEVEEEMRTVHRLADSLKTFAEAAAYGDRYLSAREDARKAMLLTGQALASAYDATAVAAEAQYHSGICGIDAVKSAAIEAEDFSTSARDLMEEAYALAKKAYGTRNLGNIHYYMRKSLNASREAEKLAQSAVYAASDSFRSCTHNDISLGGNEK